MIGVKFTGGPALAAALRAMPEAASQTIVLGALHEAGDVLAEVMGSYMERGEAEPHAADNVVVNTVNTITDGITERPVLPDEYAVAVGPAKDFFYWFFREYGTVYQSATPAMRPAWDSTVERCLRILVETLAASIAAKAAAGAGTAG